MDELVSMLFNRYVLAYLAIIVGLQLLYRSFRDIRATVIVRRRHRAGLPTEVLLDHAENLAQQRRQAMVAGGLLLASLVGAPALIVGLAEHFAWPVSDGQKNGLAGMFLTLVLWLAFTGTDVARATLSGLAFSSLVAFKHPFQIGDRVTIRGVSGKVVGLDSFFVQLDTIDDDRINIPTHTLWSEVLSSANAGARASLCVIPFYLSPHASPQQRQAAEDALWDAIQASAFFEPGKPLQIYLSQTPWSIQLTAKAYVAATYNEALFSSDVNRAFLDFTAAQGIPLASPPGALPTA